MPYTISSWTVADNASLSISKSKLVYRSMIFVNNKLTLICQQLATVSVRHTQLILLISGEFCIFEEKSVRQMGRMTPVGLISPNVHRF